MILKNDRELCNTQEKLRLLEAEYTETSNDLAEDPRVRQLSLQSLKKLINQLSEEIARYKACSTVRL